MLIKGPKIYISHHGLLEWGICYGLSKRIDWRG